MIAALLAGGQSRRMGADKAFLDAGGAPMIERVITAIKPEVRDLVIVANDLERFEKYGLSVYQDVIKGMGPLSGLYTAFEKTGADEVFLIACDLPLLSGKIVRLILSRAAGTAADAVIPVVGGVEQGLLAIYRRPAIEKFRSRIEAASIQFDEFRNGLEREYIGEGELREVEPDLRSFTNVNTPEDLAEVSRLLSRRGQPGLT